MGLDISYKSNYVLCVEDFSVKIEEGFTRDKCVSELLRCQYFTEYKELHHIGMKRRRIK